MDGKGRGWRASLLARSLRGCRDAGFSSLLRYGMQWRAGTRARTCAVSCVVVYERDQDGHGHGPGVCVSLQLFGEVAFTCMALSVIGPLDLAKLEVS
jgi:hypothetical protein